MKAKKAKSRVVPHIPPEAWLRTIQFLIKKHSTAPRKRGKYKGHGSTDVEAWTGYLVRAMKRHLRITATCPFDENMAIAYNVGSVLLMWWAAVQRAKTYDPARPLAKRREVNIDLDYQLSAVFRLLHSDSLMGAVFGEDQDWNFPFGRGARGGDFV